MHENDISEKIIGAAIKVHRILGPGLLESVYEEALAHELNLRGIRFLRQKKIPIPLLTYLRLTEKHLGLIINFHVQVLCNGIYRVVNKLPK